MRGVRALPAGMGALPLGCAGAGSNRASARLSWRPSSTPSASPASTTLIAGRSDATDESDVLMRRPTYGLTVSIRLGDH